MKKNPYAVRIGRLGGLAAAGKPRRITERERRRRSEQGKRLAAANNARRKERIRILAIQGGLNWEI